jgi:hypothetical protein
VCGILRQLICFAILIKINQLLSEELNQILVVLSVIDLCAFLVICLYVLIGFKHR